MDKVASLPAKQRQDPFGETATQRGLNPAIVEKDFWVCWVLKQIFTDDRLKTQLVFKGGTSLSKVFGLIDRFSEDIDLVLDWQLFGYGKGSRNPFPESMSNTQRVRSCREVNEKAGRYIAQTLIDDLHRLFGKCAGVVASIDASDPLTVNVTYSAAYSEEYLRSEVRLEIGPLASWVPSHEHTIQPYAAEEFPGVFDDATCPVVAIDAERTFWEKATILHQQAHRTGVMPSRYSRHYYDMHRIALSPIRKTALDDLQLLADVVAFKEQFYHCAWARYQDAKPGSFKLLPSKQHLAELRSDYSDMGQMIFGKPPAFDEIIATLKMLEDQINTQNPATAGRTQPAMNKMDAKTDGATVNIVEENIDRLRELFPDAFTESSVEGEPRFKVDFDALREILGDSVEDQQERYRFTWNGKARARRIAQTPSTATLRPASQESLHWDTTHHLFIEGDNLEVLKLLQKSYHKRVNVIYIDPPYNTGKEFIYPDKYKDNLATYLRYTGQIDEEGMKLSANAETSGRYHTNWLNMMYPRLQLGRNLLADDGVIFISIDEHECSNLRKLVDEVFGEENFIAELAWEKTRKNDAKLFSVGHEYMFVYARDLQYLKDCDTIWREQKPGAAEILERWKELKLTHGDNYTAMEGDLRYWYGALPQKHPSKKLSRYRHIDERGPWRDRDISWPGGGGPRYDVIHPVTGKPCAIPDAGWRFSTAESMQRQISLGLIEFREDHSKPPFRKAHLLAVEEELDADACGQEDGDDSEDGDNGVGLQVMPSVIYKQAQVATKYLRKLMGAKLFDNPKDHEVLARLIGYVTGDDAVVLDYFAGSCSTAEAVLRLNQKDGGSRRFLMVQLPERLGADNKDQKAAFQFCQSLGSPENIAEVGKERIRRAIKKIGSQHQQIVNDAREQLPGVADDVAELDLGFKVFKLDSSNIKPWDAEFENLDQALLDSVENIKPDRSEMDVLYELLLKFGLDLAVPIEERKIAGKTVFIIGAGALIVCLASDVTIKVVEGIAKLKEELKPEIMRVVFKDASFKDDVVKTNAVQILRQAGIEDVKSL